MRTRPSQGDADSRAIGLLNQPASREVIPRDPAASFRFYKHSFPHPNARWGHHPEYEVHLILKTSGRYVIGDVIDSFDAGQLTLIGPNLPHHWITDTPRGETVEDRDAVLHFSDEWIRGCQVAMPELESLDTLLRNSHHGIEFRGPAATLGAAALLRIGDAPGGIDRVIAVLDLLRVLAAAPPEHAVLVARAWLPQSKDQTTADLVSRAIDYILDNISGDVRLTEAARLAAMSDSAFSRYFKAASGQTFTEMVRRLRLTRACQLLERTEDQIASIAVAVGYDNLSNFNRQFLQSYGMTPRQHRTTSRLSSQHRTDTARPVG